MQSVFVVFSILALSYGQILTNDIKELRHELFVTRRYDKYAIPIPEKDHKLTVSIGFSLIHIRNVDIQAQNIELDGWVLQQWHDDGLKWKGTKWDYIKVLRVPAQEVYNPDIMIYNTVDYNKRKIEKTNVLLYPNGLVMWVPPATHKIACNLNLKRWPYDEHICFIKFGSWTYDGYVLDVDYIKDKNTTFSFISDFWKSSEFDVEYLNVTRKENYYPCCVEPYPAVTFYFKLSRRANLYNYLISMPALVAIISSVIAFWLPIRSMTRFVLNGFSLLTLTLLLLHLGTQLGFSSLGVPVAVRFVSVTTLFVGIIQIWFTIAYNISLLQCAIPLWTSKLTKPLLQMYRNSEHESIQLTNAESNPDNGKKSSQPTAEHLTYVIDKMALFVFALALAINSFAF